MKLERDRYDSQTVYALLRNGEQLTDAGAERAQSFAASHRAAFVEVRRADDDAFLSRLRAAAIPTPTTPET